MPESSKSFFATVFSLIGRNVILLPLFLFVLFSIGQPSWHVYLTDAFGACSLLAVSIKYGLSRDINGVKYILLFSIMYFILVLILDKSTSLFQTLGYLICPTSFYCFGYAVMEASDSDDDIPVFIFLTVVASSLLLWVRTFADVQTSGIINMSRTIENENGVVEASATALGLVASVGLSGIAYVIVSQMKNKLLSVLYLLAFAMSLFAVIHLVNRSGLIIVIVTMFACWLYVSNSKKASLILMLIMAALIFVLYETFDIFGSEALDAYMDREEFGEFSAQSIGGRADRWMKSLVALCQYPFGWSKSLFGYGHNMWLDVAQTAGWLPFLLLVVASVKHYRISLKLFSIKGNPFNGMFFGINACLFMSAFVEPILDAIPLFFYIICMVWGIQMAYYKKTITE